MRHFFLSLSISLFLLTLFVGISLSLTWISLYLSCLGVSPSLSSPVLSITLFSRIQQVRVASLYVLPANNFFLLKKLDEGWKNISSKINSSFNTFLLHDSMNTLYSSSLHYPFTRLLSYLVTLCLSSFKCIHFFVLFPKQVSLPSLHFPSVQNASEWMSMERMSS